MVSALKVAISYEAQYILNILGKILSKCQSISVILSSSEQTVTDEQYQDFTVVIGKTEYFLGR